jgi:hypothetical protein
VPVAVLLALFKLFPCFVGMEKVQSLQVDLGLLAAVLAVEFLDPFGSPGVFAGETC